jgi:xylulose-5-phosphate/fructose-6-phosphate phosphoketolase
MVLKNYMIRFHRFMDALRRSDYPQAGPLVAWCEEMLAKHKTYTREHFEDMPEIRDWKWSSP